MDVILNITDKTPLSRINDKEEKLKRLTNVKGASFESELEAALDKSGTKKKPVDKKLWNACIEAESLFVGKMLKEMKSTVHKSEWLHGGQAEEIFEDMLYDEYALSVSKNSDFGMAKMLYEELSRKM